MIVKINKFQADLSDISARQATLVSRRRWASPVITSCQQLNSREVCLAPKVQVLNSVAVLAEVSLRSPRKLFFFIIKKIYLQDQSIQK